MLTDRELLERWGQKMEGGTDAFEELVRRHVGMVYRTARRMLGGPAREAEDVVQGVFWLLAQRGSQVKGENLGGWLYRVTVYACSNVRREEWRRKKREREVGMARGEAVVDDDTRERMLGVLDEGMMKLSERERRAVVARYLEGKSAEEAGADLGVTAQVAEKRARRGVERLRRFFGKRGVIAGVAGVVAVMGAEAGLAAPVEVLKVAVGAGSGAVSGAGVVLAKGAMGMLVRAMVLRGVVGAAVLGAVAVVGGLFAAERAAPLPTQVAATEVAQVGELATVARLHEANLKRIKTWEVHASVEDDVTDENGRHHLESKVSFWGDMTTGIKRWTWQVENATREIRPGQTGGDPANIDTRDEMVRNDGFFRLAPGLKPAGSNSWERTLVVLRPEEAEANVHPTSRSFDASWYMTKEGIPISEFLDYVKVHAGEYEKHSTQIRVIREGSKVILTLETPSTTDRYTFDINFGGNLVLTEKLEGAKSWTTQITYQSVNDVWVPETYLYEIRSGTETSLRRKVTFLPPKINAPLSDDEFTLATLGVKAGTRVTDNRVGLFYVYGKETTTTNALGGHSHVKEQPPILDPVK